MLKERKVARSGPFQDYIANGISEGDTIYLSGQVSLNDDGEIVGKGDLAAQIRQAYVNVSKVLGHFGATMDDVVDETWFITDIAGMMENIDALFAIRAEAYGKQPDVAQTTVQVGGLVMPELMIEIKCVARI